uniref:Uncharacterized protein n=1 Tax=Anguilla anguilla TaxID=7936 RepID=A0A0E9T5G5_ANGAN
MVYCYYKSILPATVYHSTNSGVNPRFCCFNFKITQQHIIYKF